MNIEYPSAFALIFQDDLYLSNKDRDFHSTYKIPLPDLEATQFELSYLGGNKENFLIIVDYAEEEFIKTEHLTALQSILKRMDFEMDHVALFNVAKYPGVQLTELTEFFNPNKLLMLGDSALPAGMGPIALNETVAANNLNMLYSFSFDEMMDNTSNKKIFWERVKQL